MKAKFIQGLKPLIFKHIALAVSLCYMLAPLQNELLRGLHTISHHLEMPSTILAHQSTGNSTQSVHTQHNHEIDHSGHDHSFIDLIDTVFEASGADQNSDKTELKISSLKKHLNTSNYNTWFINTVLQIKIFDSFIPSISDGYPNKIYSPPILSIC